MAGEELQEDSGSSPATVLTEKPQLTLTLGSLNPNEESSKFHATLRHEEAMETPSNSVAVGESGVVECNLIELSDDLSKRGKEALNEKDFGEAVDCFSRALEIRVSHYGELAPECMNAYYQYGKSLLYKAQEETDPIGAVPNKEASGSAKASTASSSIEEKDNTKAEEPAADEEESGESDDDENVAETEDDESDLDMAWKMLDIARAISEKQGGDTMEKVDILSALAEVALEREDIETSLADYMKALATLERIVEPDSRYLAELHFRVSLCLEFGYQIEEAMIHCRKALDICKSRMQRLKDEPQAPDNASEIETLAGLSEELEKKLEDLQQIAANPRSMLSEILASVRPKSEENERPDVSQMGSENLAASKPPAHANGDAGVKDLGVVGRGVKRVAMASQPADANSGKKREMDWRGDDGDGK